jgi:hypothetical protein
MGLAMLLSYYTSDGRLTQEESLASVRLMRRAVLPALRKKGDEGLRNPFEANAPVSVAAGPLLAPATLS